METPGQILFFHFPTQYDVTSTFFRFEGHYESPHVSGTVFTHEQYMDAYAHNRKRFAYRWADEPGKLDESELGDRNFTYTLDWGGFNVPSSVFRPFFEGRFDPLWEKEKAVLEAIRPFPEPYYVIAAYGEDSDSLIAHEVMHALFYLQPDYAAEVRRVVHAYANAPGMADFAKHILDMGYKPEVLVDEMNAYATTGWTGYGQTKHQKRQLRPLRRQLRAMVRDRFGVDLSLQRNHAQMAQFVRHMPTLPTVIGAAPAAGKNKTPAR